MLMPILKVGLKPETQLTDFPVSGLKILKLAQVSVQFGSGNRKSESRAQVELEVSGFSPTIMMGQRRFIRGLAKTKAKNDLLKLTIILQYILQYNISVSN